MTLFSRFPGVFFFFFFFLEPKEIESARGARSLFSSLFPPPKKKTTNRRVHQRKIDVALRKYKLRYERKVIGGDGGIDLGDDDDDVSEEEEELGESESDDAASSESSDENGAATPGARTGRRASEVDDDDLLPTEEELLELQRDRDNVHIEVLFAGDEESYPQIGDVLRCHYVLKVQGSDLELENTRRSKRPFQFVLGVGQVINGWDRGVLQMSFGERSRLIISPEYGYGARGILPLIPPDATLVFDLEILRWHPRVPWIKPLIQRPNLTERPYEELRQGLEHDDDDGASDDDADDDDAEHKI